MSTRSPEYPVDPQFIGRWSPRAFTGKAMAAAELMSLFEAARWTPSTSNTQPWRCVYGLAGSPGFEAMFATLAASNQVWARRASALIAVMSATESMPAGATQPKPSPLHAFDTGAAWMSLALQAEKLGWRTHAMGGIDREALRQALAVPATFALHCVVAVGEQGDAASLDASLQAREAPNARQPLAAMVAEGRFSFER
jgi:nitroreductase